MMDISYSIFSFLSKVILVFFIFFICWNFGILAQNWLSAIIVPTFQIFRKNSFIFLLTKSKKYDIIDIVMGREEDIEKNPYYLF